MYSKDRCLAKKIGKDTVSAQRPSFTISSVMLRTRDAQSSLFFLPLLYVILAGLVVCGEKLGKFRHVYSVYVANPGIAHILTGLHISFYFICVCVCDGCVCDGCVCDGCCVMVVCVMVVCVMVVCVMVVCVMVVCVMVVCVMVVCVMVVCVMVMCVMVVCVMVVCVMVCVSDGCVCDGCVCDGCVGDGCVCDGCV